MSNDYIIDADSDDGLPYEFEDGYDDEPTVEELNRRGNIIPEGATYKRKDDDPEDIIFKEPAVEEEIIDVVAIKGATAYRRRIPGFPLDHQVRCGECLYKGKVGFKQAFCPRCGYTLISPNEVEGYKSSSKKRTGCC